MVFVFFFQAEDGIRDRNVTGVQTCALPIYGLATLGTELEMLAARIVVDDESARSNDGPICNAACPGASPSTPRRAVFCLSRSEERREGKSVGLGGRGVVESRWKEVWRSERW